MKFTLGKKKTKQVQLIFCGEFKGNQVKPKKRNNIKWSIPPKHKENQKLTFFEVFLVDCVLSEVNTKTLKDIQAGNAFPSVEGQDTQY